MSKDSKFEFHFYGSVGQQIARVENMTVNFDKDMQMHIAQVGTTNEPQHNQAETCDLPIPQKGKYNEVRMYIEQRKENDQDFKHFCKTHNRKELCRFLSTIFGWVVDDHALGTNINRH